MIYDIVVVGGGAAGLFAAVIAKKLNNNLNILVVEALDRVGKKLITTGNGQCNITNANINTSYYHSENSEFIDSVFEKFTLKDTINLFSEMGVDIVFNENGRGYPASYQAGSVVDALRFTVYELGIEVKNSVTVNDFRYDKYYTLLTDSTEISTKKVIFACGLLSGGAKLGSTGIALEMFKKLGYKTVLTTPSLVQLKTETQLVRQLKGIKFDGKATLLINGKITKENTGEILFTDYGLSGPAIFGISREAVRNSGNISVSLDILPDIEINPLTSKLIDRKNRLRKRSSEEFLTGLINKRLGQVIMKTANVPMNTTADNIPDSLIVKLAYTLKNFAFSVTGNTGFINSQVTAGGIKLTEIDIDTFESKRHKGLFIVGEMLDVDGECGGYNLQWAWSSSAIAAKSAVMGL